MFVQYHLESNDKFQVIFPLLHICFFRDNLLDMHTCVFISALYIFCAENDVINDISQRQHNPLAYCVFTNDH